MTTRLKQFLAIKANPNLAILQHLTETDAMADKMARKAVAEILESISREFREKVNELLKQLNDSLPVISQQLIDYLKDYTLAHPEKFKGAKGDYVKGDKGDTIKGDKGDSPSKKELLDIIRPLIPKVENGKSPTREELVSLINPLIPQIKVKDFSPEIKNLLEKFEELNKKIVNLRQNVRASKKGGMGNILPETPSGTINGVNTIFTITTKPKTNGYLLFLNGALQRQGSSFEFTLSDKTIAYNTAPPEGSQHYIWLIR